MLNIRAMTCGGCAVNKQSISVQEYLKKVIADTYKHPDAQEELSCYIHNFNSEHDMVYANPYNGKLFIITTDHPAGAF